jgi:hypothetical protein
MQILDLLIQNWSLEAAQSFKSWLLDFLKFRNSKESVKILRHFLGLGNGTAPFKNVNNYLNTNIYSYLETSGGQSSNVYLNLVHSFNTTVN